MPNLNKRLWKLKASLKIKIFLWYLQIGVILTKDNLVKWNWNVSVKCCCCHKEETIKHIFFECYFAWTIWNMVQVATNIYTPSSISNMFDYWPWEINKDFNLLALLWVSSICWTICRHQNNVVFEWKTETNSLQVLHSTIHWLCTWVVLQKPIF
jgi:hypothetical protein